LVSGIVFGLTVLNRPNILLAAGAIVAALVVRGASRRSERFVTRARPAALLLAGVVAGMSPAAIRNVVVSHEFTFVSSHGGLNFYIGNSATANGFYNEVPGIAPTIGGQEADTVRVASQALGHPVSDSEASDYFFGLAWRWIRDHPAAAAALFGRKLYYIFNAQFISLGQSYPFYAHETGSLLRILFIGPWLLIPLGLVGLLFGRRASDGAPALRPSIPVVRPSPAVRPTRRSDVRRKETSSASADREPRADEKLQSPRSNYAVWFVFVPGYAIAIAVFFMAERYRLPLLVPLTIGAGAAMEMGIEAIRAGRLMTLRVPAAALVVLALAANWRLRLDDGQWQNGVRLAESLVIEGQDADAATAAAKIAVREPRPGATDSAMGAQFLQMNHPDRALPYLQRAHDENPDDAATDYSLGQALLALGRVQDAIPHLRRGFDAGIPLPQGGYDYALALRDAGDLAGAVAAVRHVAPRADDSDAWLRAGRLAVEAKAPDAAEPFFRRAVQIRPDAASHQQLGVDLMLLGKYPQAAAELAEAARLDPNDAGTLSHLSYCEMKLGRLNDARTSLRQALAVDPNDPLARQLAAILR
ncbi:MAG TPA: tetratricopeptide repeat protein, partial [Vicinamibacterales bacterium]